VVLVFVGTKMLLVDVYKVPVLASLGVIATVLTVSVVASLLRRRPVARPEGPGAGSSGADAAAERAA
jgi:predicted tellurium resistance membrane protein TerC